MPRKRKPPRPARRPGRPPRPPRRERSDEIVAAAFAEFSAHGFAGTRLEDVARRAGIAKGTIYLHFENKELLFRAVARQLVQPALVGFGDFAEKFPGTAEQLLRQLLSQLYERMVRNEKAWAILRMLIAECGNFPQLAEIHRREVIEPALSAFRMVLRKGQASGEFRASAVEEFPQILVGPALAAIFWSLLLGKREPLDFDRYFEAHLEFILSGLQPRESRASAPLAQGEKS